MANIAFTTYIVESDKSTLEALETRLNAVGLVYSLNGI